MKKDYVYLIVDRYYVNDQYHFFDLHDLVICTGETNKCPNSGQTAYRAIGDNGNGDDMGQWLLLHHVIEIGKL